VDVTLVLTNVTEYGVVMAADDALTERYGENVRILQGATKLFAHYGCHCGFATWGLGALPNRNPEHAPVSVGFIVKRFVGETQRVDHLETLLKGLVDRLNGEHPKAREPAMIDVGACIRAGSGWHPVVYQVGNCDDPYAPTAIRPFTARILRPPGPYDASRDIYPIANGLLNAGYWVDAQFDAFTIAAEVTENSVMVPGNSLEKRQAFLGAVARAVSDIQLSMDLSR
jgi:hypothetical protein